MKQFDLSHLLKNAVFEGADKVIRKNKILPDYYTKAQAYRLHGRSNIDRWIGEGLITIAKVSRKCIDRALLEHIACSSNRSTYLPVAER
ncbi:MAG: hypothetical protein JWQ66_2097 [Mucilaginibacter sp.]|nr:hypothetical protein [Mucilaginibacter sp.]